MPTHLDRDHPCQGLLPLPLLGGGEGWKRAVLGQLAKVYHGESRLSGVCAMQPGVQGLWKRRLERLRGSWVTWPSSVSPSLRGPTYPLWGTSLTPRGLFTTDWDRRISSSSVLLGPSPEIVSPGLGRI